MNGQYVILSIPQSGLSESSHDAIFNSFMENSSSISFVEHMNSCEMVPSSIFPRFQHQLCHGFVLFISAQVYL